MSLMDIHSMVIHSIRTCGDVLFPPSDDTLLVRKTRLRTLLEAEQSHVTHGVHILLSFSDPAVRACVHEAKFSNNTKAQRLLAAVLLQRLPHISSAQIIIPVPLSQKRLRERGYNQVVEITRQVQKRLPGYLLKTNILTRSRHTQPQTELNKSERKKNVTDAFTLNKRKASQIQGKDIILLDDVMTTGATLLEAQRELQKARPSSITCIALAH